MQSDSAASPVRWWVAVLFLPCRMVAIPVFFAGIVWGIACEMWTDGIDIGRGVDAWWLR